MDYIQMTRCPVALDDGSRCPDDVEGLGRRRCKAHARFNLGLNISRTQRHVLISLWDGTKPATPRSEYTLRVLSNKGLVEVAPEGGFRLTQWGRDVTGGTR